MKYRNTKTGFVFESDALCEGDGWEPISSTPEPPVKKEELKEDVKPKKTIKGKTK